MTHEMFADKLLDLAYGELSPREAGKVEAHAASCERCRVELARIRETRKVMARLPEEPAPEDGERILLAAARQAAEGRVPRRRLPPWFWSASLVAAALVAVAGVSFRIMEMRPGPLSPKAEREALLGASPVTPARPPPSPAPEAAPRAERAEAIAGREDRAPAPAARGPAEAKRKAAPEPEERPLRAYAEPPPAASRARELEAPRPAQVAPAPLLAEAPRDAAAAAPPPRAAPVGAAEPAGPPAAQEGLGVIGDGASGPARVSAKPQAPSRAAEADLAAPLRSEERTFERCEGESARRVDVDPDGRVVRYVREGRFGGRRLRVVQTFRPDGSPAAATAQDLDRAGAWLDPRALGVELAGRAEDARIDAPPRCGGGPASR